jgi:hypothetical protein
VPTFVKQTPLRLKEQIEPDTIIVGDLNALLSSIDRTFRQKVNKDILELNNTLDKMNLDIHKIFLPVTADYTSFSPAHGIFSKIDHILGHKANFNKYKKKMT